MSGRGCASGCFLEREATFLSMGHTPRPPAPLSEAEYCDAVASLPHGHLHASLRPPSPARSYFLVGLGLEPKVGDCCALEPLGPLLCALAALCAGAVAGAGAGSAALSLLVLNPNTPKSPDNLPPHPPRWPTCTWWRFWPRPRGSAWRRAGPWWDSLSDSGASGEQQQQQQQQPQQPQQQQQQQQPQQQQQHWVCLRPPPPLPPTSPPSCPSYLSYISLLFYRFSGLLPLG